MLKGVILDIHTVVTDCSSTTAPTSYTTSEVFYLETFLQDLKCSGLHFSFVSSPVSDAQPSYLPILKEWNLLPEECIVITDTNLGTISAKSAGIPSIGFTVDACSSSPQNLSHAYALLESFESADASYVFRTHAHALSYPAEILTTDRLIIRELSNDDFPILYPMCITPETAPFMNEILSDYPTEYNKHLAYISKIYPFFDLALWGVFEKSTGKLIGRAGFSLPDDENEVFSIGYLIDVPYRQKGYAKECVKALLSYAKKQGYSTVSAKVKKTNLASQKVLEHCCASYSIQKEDDDSVFFYRISL